MATYNAASPWITIPVRNPNAAIRLFCFHYAGGSATLFHRWGASMPANIEVCAIQLPGRGPRMAEPLQTSAKQVIDGLAPAIMPYLDRPFALYGHSMGALLGFELSRRLHREGGPNPQQLFVSGRRAPQLPIHTAYHALTDNAFIQRLRMLNGTPPAILEDAELMNLMLPVIRADFAICETYLYQREPPLECPILAIGGMQDPDVSYDHLAAWGTQTTSGSHVSMFPGDHFFLHTARTELIGLLARQLQQYALPFASYAA